MGEDEFADIAVQGEAVHAMTAGQHQHGGGAVQRIAGADLLGAGLQEILGGRRIALALAAQDGENGADGNVHVHVAGAVERIEYQQVFAARVLRRNRVNVIHLLRRHGSTGDRPTRWI